MALLDGLLFSVIPAAMGAGFAIAQVATAARPLHLAGEARGRAILLAALPLTGVAFALAATAIAADAPRDVRLQLMVLGGAALLQAGLQGILAARALPHVTMEPAALGRALLPIALAETIVLLPFLWVVLLSTTPVM